MLTDIAFQDQTAVVPDVLIEVLKHTDLGDRVICAYCKVNGLPAKRITQETYGKPVNEIPAWSLQNRIVSDWFALILEAKYQESIGSEPVIIHPDTI